MRPTVLLLVMALPLLSLPARAAKPAFDCKKADGEIEHLICANDALAALDVKMAATYPKALANAPEEEAKTLKAIQRGWVKGRNDCWKAENKVECVEQEYKTRLTELQITYGLLQAPDYVSYHCADGSSLTVTVYPNSELPAAVLTRNGEDQVIAYPAPSDKGVRYDGANVSYREDHGKVTVTWFDQETTCHKP